MAKEIRVPALGESVTEATIAKWFKQAGEAVKADEPLVELETDKVTVEVPAPASGKLLAIDAVAAGPARHEERHEDGEQPVADHDEELRRIVPGEVFRGAVLHREHHHRDQREADAERGVGGAHPVSIP